MKLKKSIFYNVKEYLYKIKKISKQIIILFLFSICYHSNAYGSFDEEPQNHTFTLSSKGNNIYLYLNRDIIYKNENKDITTKESIYDISLDDKYLTIDTEKDIIYLKTDEKSEYKNDETRECPIAYTGFHGNGTPIGLSFFNDPSQKKTLKINHTGEDFVIASQDDSDQDWFLLKVNGDLDIIHTIKEYTGNSGTIHMEANQGTEKRELIVTGDLSIQAQSSSPTGNIGYFSGILSEDQGYIQVGGDVDISMECSPAANDSTAYISGIALIGEQYLSHLNIAGHTYIHDIKSETSENTIYNYGFYIHNWNAESLTNFNALTISDIKSVSIDGTPYAAGILANYTRVPVTVDGNLIIKNIAAISDSSSTAMTSGAYGKNAAAYAVYAYGSKIDIKKAEEIEGDIVSVKHSSSYDADIDIDFISSGKFTGFTRTGENYASLDISLPDGAFWNVVPSNVISANERGSYVSNLTKLSLDGSNVYVGTTRDVWDNTWSDNLFASSFTPLSSTDNPTELLVRNLSGSGNFYLRTDMQEDISDSVRITDSLAGSHTLHVKGSGAEPKERQTESYLARAENNIAATGNEFSLAANTDGLKLVDIGLYNYELETSERNNGREWYLVRENTPSVDPDTDDDNGNSGTNEPEGSIPSQPDVPSGSFSPTGEAEAALSGLAGHYAMWYGYQTDLRKRLGEVRYGTQTGLWVRGFADKARLDGLAGTSFTQNLVGGSIGYDTLADVDETYMWILGMQIRSGHADQSTNGRWGGYGDLTSVGGGLYSTWVHVDGWYLDAVATMDWYNHEIRAAMLDGTPVHDDRSSYGIGASLEGGRKMDFAFSNEGRDYWFLEPQLQLSWFWVRGGSFTSSNGMTIDQSDMASLTGRAGLVLGKKFTLDEEDGPRYVQPYVKAGVNHEFLGEQRARLNGLDMRSDLDGTRVYYGLGVDWQLSDDIRLYMQAEREHGENFTREYNMSAGLKWRF